MEVQYPTFSHRQNMISSPHIFQPRTVIIPQSQNRFTLPAPLYCRNNYHMVDTVKTSQTSIIQESTADQGVLSLLYREDASTHPTSETEDGFPQIYVNFVVTDKVTLFF